MLSLFKKFNNFLGEKGFGSTADIATGMTMMVLVGTIATVTGNSLIKDTEERAHVFNAQTLATAANTFINENNGAPSIGNTMVITLQELKDQGKIGKILDPSNVDRTEYNLLQTRILVENKYRLDTESDQTELTFYVKLSNRDNTYRYINEITLPGTVLPINAADLTRDHVSIPSRSPDGKLD